jgi:putative ABC transport system substrate-binding protein
MGRTAVSRRAFLASSAGFTVAARAAVAQQAGKVYRIGVLHTGALGSPETQAILDSFRQGLRERGYVDGRNIVLEYRAADGHIERLQGLANELVRLGVDVIVAVATPAGRAAQRATTTIPIVVSAMGDPVGDGLVASLARPGGNLTGTTFLGPKLVSKHLALLKEALPRAAVVAILWHPDAFSGSTMREMRGEAEAAAKTLGIRLQFVEVRNPGELDGAFSAMIPRRPDGLAVFPTPMFFAARRRIVTLAAKHRLPSIFNNREAVELGGLMGYGTNLRQLQHRTAAYVDRILKGAHPETLPVEQPGTFELVINLKTARALGLVIPPSLLAQADHVID